jgi:alpha,alpha-trehalose phosphorylase
VIEQADLVPATHTCAAFFDEAFEEEQTARDFAYYEPLTVRDSSPSA